MPFQKGNKLGPGRPKQKASLDKEAAKEYIRKRVSAELEPIMDKAIEQAKAGDAATRKDLFDRAYDKPRESVDVSAQVEFLNFPKEEV